MFSHGKNALLAGVVVLCGMAMSARADIVFNFNSLSPGVQTPRSQPTWTAYSVAPVALP